MFRVQNGGVQWPRVLGAQVKACRCRASNPFSVEVVVSYNKGARIKPLNIFEINSTDTTAS